MIITKPTNLTWSVKRVHATTKRINNYVHTEFYISYYCCYIV